MSHATSTTHWPLEDGRRAIDRVPAPWLVRRLARICALLLLTLTIGLLVTPWLQNVMGEGKVIADDPLDRPTPVEAPVSGRIISMHVREGTVVKKGDVIVDLRALDPEYLNRLKFQKEFLKEKLTAANNKMTSMERVVEAVKEARDAKINSAKLKVEMGAQKVKAEQLGLIAAKAVNDQMEKQLERTQKLASQEIVSPQDREIDERKLAETKTKLEQADAYVKSANYDLDSDRQYLIATSKEEQSKIDKALGELEASKGEVALVSKELSELESKIAEQETQLVRATRDGIVQSVFVSEGDVVKASERLAVLIPNTESRLVEIFVKGVDAPLISPGRKCRLQFEGWPAVQFSGWPSVAVGTFGGQVRVVDANAGPDGKFRVLVEPDPTSDPWPMNATLRQGALSRGWILLDQVKLGYEIWRRLNGFPPSLANKSKDKTKDKEDASDKDKDDYKIKLKK